MNEIVAETSYGKVWLEGDILIGTFTEKLVIDLTIARDMVKDRLAVAGEKAYAILVEIDKVKGVDNSARNYLASAEGTHNLKAAAFVGTSYVSRIIGNIFMTFNKPLIPTRLFTDKEEALRWLKQF